MGLSALSLGPLRWPEHLEKLERIDTSFTADVVCDVRSEVRGFAIFERAAEPPIHKRYSVRWGELATATFAVVAERESSLIGVASLEYEEWNRRAIISHLYVDRAVRGQGIGMRLLNELKARAAELNARQLFVETQNVNVPAIRFYERNGFDLVGLDTSLYDDAGSAGESALYFAMRLGAPGI